MRMLRNASDVELHLQVSFECIIDLSMDENTNQLLEGGIIAESVARFLIRAVLE